MFARKLRFPLILVSKRHMTSAQMRSTTASGSQVYESKRAVDEYLSFHFGKPDDQMPFKFGPIDALNFTERCSNVCNASVAHLKEVKSQLRALDIGCAVGGSAFHLARHFNEVVGIDFSQHFIDTAIILKENSAINYEMLQEGNLFKHCKAEVPVDIDRSRLDFQQGDACNMSKSLGKFDVILASNLLCRLPNPRKFLSDVPSFLESDGCLVLVSPYSWLEEYSPKQHWIGAVAAPEGSGRCSADELMRFMSEHAPSLRLVHEEDMPFLIREHARKYQYGVSSCTVWRKHIS